MDALSLLRTIGALGMVLGLLAGALWTVRRYDIRLPGRVGGGTTRRVEMVERLSLDAKRSVALIRRDGREHLILIAPDGHVMIETGIVREAEAPVAEPEAVVAAAPPAIAVAAVTADDAQPKPAAATPAADLAAVRAGFAALVDRASSRVRRSDATEASAPAVAEAAPTPLPADLSNARARFATLVERANDRHVATRKRASARRASVTA